MTYLKDLIKQIADLKKKEKFKEALDILEDLYKKTPISEDIKTLLIETLFSYGGYLNDIYTLEYDEAKNIFKRIIEIEPNNYRAYYNLGIAYFNLEEMEKAIESYETAIKIKPDYKYCIYNLGLIYETLKDYKKAIKYYEKVLEIDPKFPYALQARYDVRSKLDNLKGVS